MEMGVVTSRVVNMCFNRYILFMVNYLKKFRLTGVVLWEDVSLCQANLFAWMRRKLKDFRLLHIQVFELISKYAKEI